MKRKHRERSSSLDLGRVQQQLEKIQELFQEQVDIRVTGLWMQEYSRLSTSVTDEAVRSMKAILHEFVSAEKVGEIKKERGETGFEAWIETLLTTQRIYEYLLFAHGLERSFRVPARFPDAVSACRRWLRELCWNEEFWLVHVRQGGFYPQFTKLVNENLFREADRADQFARESTDKADIGKLLTQAQDMRHCARLAISTLTFEEIHNSNDKDPLRQKCLEFARENNRLPLTHKNFVYLWMNGLEEFLQGAKVPESEPRQVPN